MTRRGRIILVGVLLAVTVAGLAAYRAWRAHTLARQIVVWRSELTADLPQTRLAAADQLLALNPVNGRYLMAKAQALMDLERYGTARQVLERMVHVDTDLSIRATLLIADCYLDQARAQVHQASPLTGDLAADRAAPFLDEADGIARAFTGNAAAAAHVPYIQASILEVRAELLELQRRGLNFDLSRATAGQASGQAQGASLQLGNIEAQLNELNARIEDICNKAATANRQDPRPLVVLCQMWLRRHDVVRLRDTAGQLAQIKALPAHTAGQIARMLLNLDWTIGMPVTARDVALARTLLSRTDLAGRRTVNYWLAQGDLALRDQNWMQAQTCARHVLQQFDAQPTATCQLALAQTQMGHGEQAARMLADYLTYANNPEVRYALGLVYRTIGSDQFAKDAFRRVLEQRPDCLPARLALISTLAATTDITNAEADIRAAYRTSPQDPQALRYYADLLVRRGAMKELADLLQASGPGAAGAGLDVRHVRLAAALAMDDRARGARLAKEILQDTGDDALAWVAHAWSQAPLARQFPTAALVDALMLDRMDADPLQEADDPVIPALALAKGTATRPSAQGLELDVLGPNRFLASPAQMGFSLVQAALERWPDDRSLRQDEVVLGVLSGHRPLVLDRGEPARADGPRRSWQQRIPVAQAAVEAQHPTAPAQTANPLQAWLAVAQAPVKSLPGELETQLQNYPWSQSLVRLALLRALTRGSPRLASACVEAIRPVNPQLALLAAARLHVCCGDLLDARQELDKLLKDEPGASELRFAADEIESRMHLLAGTAEVAAGAYESGAVSAPWRAWALQAAAVDVRLAAGRRAAAGASITGLLADPRTPARWLDQYLARAVVLLSPQRLGPVLDQVLQFRPREPILLLYKARWLARQGSFVEARDLLNRVAALDPDAPRLLMTQAQLARWQGNRSEAAALYKQLLKCGPGAAAAARRDLTTMEADPR